MRINEIDGHKRTSERGEPRMKANFVTFHNSEKVTKTLKGSVSLSVNAG